MRPLCCPQPEMRVAWNGWRWSTRKEVEIELIGCDTELDGDEGKEGSGMTPGICPTDTLSPVQNAASSRLCFFFFHWALFVIGKLGKKHQKGTVWIIMVYLFNGMLWNQNKTMKNSKEKSLVYITVLKNVLTVCTVYYHWYIIKGEKYI